MHTCRRGYFKNHWLREFQISGTWQDRPFGDVSKQRKLQSLQQSSDGMVSLISTRDLRGKLDLNSTGVRSTSTFLLYNQVSFNGRKMSLNLVML